MSDNDDMDLSDSSQNNKGSKRCFSSIRSTTFWSPVAACSSLCPSMDLLVVGVVQQKTAGGTTHLHLHRTVTGQKLATIQTTNHQVTETITSSNTTHHQHYAVQHTAWRPDGRLLATADDAGQITLYHVEDLMMQSNSGSSASSSTGSTGGSSSLLLAAGMAQASTAAQGQIHVLQVKNDNDGASAASSSIVGMTWAVIGKPHPAWTLAEEEMEADYSFNKIRCKYLDRQDVILQPSQYHVVSQTADKQQCQTPLSLLAAATTAGLQLYLHGRYPFLNTLPLPFHKSSSDVQTNVTMVVSTDLTHLLATATVAGSSKSVHDTTNAPLNMTLYSFPGIIQFRVDLQIVSALSTSVSTHVQQIRTTIHEVAASFKSSLKPLDMKFDKLTVLLQNYGLLSDSNKTKQKIDDDPRKMTMVEMANLLKSHGYHDEEIKALKRWDRVRALQDLKAENASAEKPPTSIQSYLVQYILSGHTKKLSSSNNNDLSNAIDQFFTGIQMNDQLLVRMETSLSAAVANVESDFRQHILAPAQVLIYQAGILNGLALARPELLSVAAATELQQCSELVQVSASAALTVLIDARFRLEDCTAWLRSTGAQIKARGTAVGSVQRENAKKRRVSDAVVQRMLQYLRQDNNSSSSGSLGGSSSSVTESILGLRFSQLLHESPSVVELSTDDQCLLKKTTPTLPYVIDKTSIAANKFFEHPRNFLSQFVKRTDVQMQSTESGTARVAVTTRVGCGGIDPANVPFGESQPHGFFAPRAVNDDRLGKQFRQWAVIAQARHSPALNCDCIQLHAIPLSWTVQDIFYDQVDMESAGIAASFVWKTLLMLPDDTYTIQEIAFYGDDGKSSLSSGSDSGSGKERRQGLGLLVRCGASLEFWLLSYDDLTFQRSPLQQADGPDAVKISCHANPADYDPSARISVQSMPESYDEDEEAAVPDGVLYAKTRQVSTLDTDALALLDSTSFSRLLLCGSRGIGAVFCAQSGGIKLELLDLEEDEEMEDDEE